MAFNPFGRPAARAGGPWLPSHYLLIGGAAASLLADGMALALNNQFIPLRVGLILAGLALALSGVNQRLRHFAEALEERGITAAYLAAGSFVVLLAYLATSPEWDSFQLVLGVFVGVGLAGSLLVLLPQLIRRFVIVLLVLFHFGGILTAVFSVAPPSGVPCWMTSALWTYVYRPYLQFMYLNNAYHFYSPEPGSATQLWFCVKYDNPKVPPRWLQVPRREDYPSRLLFQRATALTEATTPPRLGFPPDYYKAREWRRHQVSEWIPWHTDPSLQMWSSQYREPRDLDAKKFIASYARHVARDLKSRNPDSPDTPVRSVKVYRVLHNMLSAQEMAARMDPDEPTKMLPVYVGEFDTDGNLLDPTDPLLYWVVPILRVPDGTGGSVVKDYVAVHAGSKPPFVKDN